MVTLGRISEEEMRKMYYEIRRADAISDLGGKLDQAIDEGILIDVSGKESAGRLSDFLRDNSITYRIVDLRAYNSLCLQE